MRLTNQQISKLVISYILSKFPNSSVDTQKITNAVLKESKFAILSECGFRKDKSGDVLFSLWGEGATYHTLWFLKNGKISEQEGCCSEHCLTLAQYLKKFVFDSEYGKR